MRVVNFENKFEYIEESRYVTMGVIAQKVQDFLSDLLFGQLEIRVQLSSSTQNPVSFQYIAEVDQGPEG